MQAAKSKNIPVLLQSALHVVNGSLCEKVRTYERTFSRLIRSPNEFICEI